MTSTTSTVTVPSAENLLTALRGDEVADATAVYIDG